MLQLIILYLSTHLETGRNSIIFETINCGILPQFIELNLIFVYQTLTLDYLIICIPLDGVKGVSTTEQEYDFYR